MYQANLIYTSRAVVNLSAEIVSEIADNAARRNKEVGVTGLLVCGGGRFLQVLEGDRRELTQLYARIAADPRHCDCQILLEEAHVRRRFPEWHMGHLSVGEPSMNDQLCWDELCRKADRVLADQASIGGDPVITLIREFINRFGNTRKHPSFSA